MRLLYFLIHLCFIHQSFAADCVSSAPLPGQTQINSGGVFNCDNLFINTPLNLTGIGGALLEINVTNEVQITANIILNGNDGANGNTASLSGGLGGPGAGDGGGTNVVSAPEDGTDGVLANGKAAPSDGACPNGGGGGGMFTVGEAGSLCLTTLTFAGAAGAMANGIEFDFSGLLFRGGYGGGAGGINTGDVGTGGGGGGALHIIAGGNVTISSGVTIFSRGGNGGSAFLDGGGGGAGSGGAIWIQSSGVISNSATIDLRGGTGGSAITAAVGGGGGDGVFFFQDSNTTTTGSGLTLPSVSRPSLKSDITCGTIAKSENKNTLYQSMMGFSFAMILGMLIRILSRSRVLLSLKSVYRN